MAVCRWCKQEMLDPNVTGCTGNTVVEYPDGCVLPSEPYHAGDPGSRCHDCSVMVDEPHHPGCDMERCPRCQGQLISCGCLSEDGAGV